MDTQTVEHAAASFSAGCIEIPDSQDVYMSAQAEPLRDEFAAAQEWVAKTS